MTLLLLSLFSKKLQKQLRFCCVLLQSWNDVVWKLISTNLLMHLAVGLFVIPLFKCFAPGAKTGPTTILQTSRKHMLCVLIQFVITRSCFTPDQTWYHSAHVETYRCKILKLSWQRCRSSGCRRTPKSFDSSKIRTNSWKFGQNPRKLRHRCFGTCKWDWMK